MFVYRCFALSADEQKAMKESFQLAWIDYCNSQSTITKTMTDYGFVWDETKSIIKNNDVEKINIERIFEENISSMFLGQEFEVNFFEEGSFARISGDYLEKLYIEIKDLYVDLSAKELEKHSIIKPSYIKRLLALFNSISAI